MSSPGKPCNSYINQLRYLRHRQKLVTIDSQNPKPTVFDPLSSSHRIRHYSAAFHQQQQEQIRNNQNQKLLQKLLDISKRKKSLYSNNKPIPKITTFNNPARKKRQKMITQMNSKMAERLLNKQSKIDHKALRRSIDEYQQIKKSMYNNRKILHATRPSLPILNKRQLGSSKASKQDVQLFSEQKGKEGSIGHMTIE